MPRLSRYCARLAEELCRRLAEGETLAAICADPAMPPRGSVYDWLAEERAFLALYRRARRLQLDSWADEIVALADGLAGDAAGAAKDREALQRAKLSIEVRQWLVARLLPLFESEAKAADERPRVIRVVTGIDRGEPEPAPPDSEAQDAVSRLEPIDSQRKGA